MNSLVSYKWLSQYVDLDGITPEEFAKRVSLCGPAVEKIIPRDELLKNVVVGKILEVTPHPNADKLRICMVDVGDADPIQIVCGGSNLEVGQFVALAKVGAKVKWHGEGEPVILEPVKLRGAESLGMICASEEIGLGDAFPSKSEKEILDLGKELEEPSSLKPGTPIADLLGLSDDVVMDIEVTTNRVDAMGMVGMAREASAILSKPLLWKPSKEKKREANPLHQKHFGGQGSEGRELSIKVHDKKLCPRYKAVRIKGVKNGQSPWWMKQQLMSAGLNSISLLVDITNYILLEYAQPMHVFDVARLKKSKETPELHVRLAQADECIVALDGKTYELNDQALVIADAEGPVAVAGIMGGERSGAYEDTEDIILECANFDPVSIRKTSRRINLYSDSQLRFEKGLSTEAIPVAMARAVELVLELAGGKVVAVEDVVAHAYKPHSFSISSKEVVKRIGVEIPEAHQVKILNSLGFKAKATKGVIKAEIPWWRDHDIEDGVDLVEEIARIFGYGNIPAVLPVGEMPPRPRDPVLAWEDHLKTIMRGIGYTELYSYSLVSDAIYEKAGFNPTQALHLLNPLSEEFAFMRTSLLPSMVQAIAENQERRQLLKFFEVANAFTPKEGNKTHPVWTDLPDERLHCVGGVLNGEKSFAEAKGAFERVLKEMGIQDVAWKRISEDGFWHPGRSVQAFAGEILLGTVGEVSPQVLKRFKIDGRLACFESPLAELFSQATLSRSYTPPNPFPETSRDIAVIVDQTVEYAEIESLIKSIDPLVASVEWFDTYQGKGLAEGKKSVAMHLTFASRERTLTGEDVERLMEKTLKVLEKRFGASVR
jgi:phenylalanyl-tRNA synthetase beta chain